MKFPCATWVLVLVPLAVHGSEKPLSARSIKLELKDSKPAHAVQAEMDGYWITGPQAALRVTRVGGKTTLSGKVDGDTLACSRPTEAGAFASLGQVMPELVGWLVSNPGSVRVFRDALEDIQPRVVAALEKGCQYAVDARFTCLVDAQDDLECLLKAVRKASEAAKREEMKECKVKESH
jgi:hypothetical protein